MIKNNLNILDRLTRHNFKFQSKYAFDGTRVRHITFSRYFEDIDVKGTITLDSRKETGSYQIQRTSYANPTPKSKKRISKVLPYYEMKQELLELIDSNNFL